MEFREKILVMSNSHGNKRNSYFYSKGKSERVIIIGSKKILMLHSHKQRVKLGLLILGLYAREKGVDIALFGHTHIPAEQMYEGVLLLQPQQPFKLRAVDSQRHYDRR